ncbi:hypothetical protein GCM10023350_13050 [Nocardioides endophyticus]|uniref:Uncharacterized protein n=1 Tax=Nocardioides endophyticus TaxID=1353775 RepID=A0ABP8YL30_9ACTN
MRRAEQRARKNEPHYVWCTECETVVERVLPEEKSPHFLRSIVSNHPHAMTVLNRTSVREVAGDQSAAVAFERLHGHEAAAIASGFLT